MYERYHIPMKTMQARAAPAPKFVIVRADNCINCGKCEKSCIYGAHKRSEQDPRKMADPLNELCKNCFRCIGDCPQRALIMSPGPEYKTLGSGVWTPLRITTIWGEAETGKIPVLGAGYRGMFAGPGYDGMWTDMSEIVRPTRDGIHGREFISTSVDIGRKPAFLEFGKNLEVVSVIPPIIELPIPVVLDLTRLTALFPNMVAGYYASAQHLKTLIMTPPSLLPHDATQGTSANVVPVYPEGTDLEKLELPLGTRMAEIHFTKHWADDAKIFKERFPEVVLAIRMTGSEGVEMVIPDMARANVEVVHVDYDEQGFEQNAKGRQAKESLRAIHASLVSKRIRDQITVIAGGGIAAAEHVPKSLLCGADVVTLEKALLISLECRDCISCSENTCPVNLRGAPSEWIEGRVQNMVGAWRDQLLEVLGAMGLREVRRLRGELGRAIFYEDVEREAFSGIEGGAQDG